jgi:hypothetical protein
LRIEKVETILLLVDGYGILMRIVLKDELFEVEKSSLVLHLLSDLDHGTPCVLGRKTCAVRALTVLNDELDFEDLLQDCRGEDLLLHRKLDSETLAVWFCPDETCVNETHFVETFQLLQTDSKELS